MLKRAICSLVLCSGFMVSDSEISVQVSGFKN